MRPFITALLETLVFMLLLFVIYVVLIMAVVD